MNDYEEAPHLQHEPMSTFNAVLKLRCPECKKGIVYRKGMEMNHLCPSCGIKFERELGYFSGAIWIALLCATPIVLFIMFLFVYFFRDLHPALSGLFAALSFIPLVPITIRLSRSMWMYLDHQMHPQRKDPERPDDPGKDHVEPVVTLPTAGREQSIPECPEPEQTGGRTVRATHASETEDVFQF